MNWEELLNDNPELWITALEEYQQKVVLELIKLNDNKSIVAAERWVCYGTSNTFPFGVKKVSAKFFENLKNELLKFICGDPEYDEERKELSKHNENMRAYVIGVVSAAIALKLGTSAVFLAPAVVILLFSFGKCTLKAVCANYKASGEDVIEG